MTLVWGMVAYAAMVIGLLSALRGFNWFTVPFAALGIVFSLAVLFMFRSRRDAAPIAALVSNAIALVIGLLRLWGGAGI
jgi:hypothetical protein